MERRLSGGVILAIASTTGVEVHCICCSIKFIGMVVKERDSPGMHVCVVGWGGSVNIEKGDSHTLLCNLEGDTSISSTMVFKISFMMEWGCRALWCLLTKFSNEWVLLAMIADIRVDITFVTEASSLLRNVFLRVMM